MMQQYGRRPNQAPTRRGGTGAPSQVFCAAKSWRRGNSLAPGMFDPLGVERPQGAEPKNKTICQRQMVLFLVRAWGLEPQRRKHENLNLACLPISSCPHSNAILPQPRAGSKQKIAVRFLKAAETRKRCIFYFVLRLHNGRETHGANPVSPAFLIRFRRAAAPPSGAAFFRRTSASRCRTRRGWSGAASE